jgi:ribose 1,5-bisphosphokinase
LIYVMGPSGAGKDTLLEYTRHRRPPGVVFAHRYITRDAGYGGEAHVPLSPGDFRERRQRGLFALSWKAHETWYGIGVEIDAWMGQGLSVVVSGSRSALGLALNRYPCLRPVLITASPQVLRARLKTRGREDDRGIDQRLLRGRDVVCSGSRPVCLIDNSGAIERAGKQLLASLV